MERSIGGERRGMALKKGHREENRIVEVEQGGTATLSSHGETAAVKENVFRVTGDMAV